jgi:uncharacterized membrane protein YeaQ/YmgE (transglycosylase-associated protein family)
MSKDGRNRRMRAFLRKPVSEQALINAIQGVLRLRRQEGSQFHPAGFIMSLIGAIILVFLARLIS